MNEYWNALALIEMVRGNAEQAVSFFEKAQEIDPTPYFHIEIRRGRAYEESGWRDKAIEQYRYLLDTWKDADPGIPIVEETHRHLERLTESS